MRITWQAAAAAAGVGFLISVLSGLFGGVTLGTLLFRAVLAAVIFGAGAVGVEQIFQRFLPELFTGSDGEAGERDAVPGASSSAEAGGGGNIEIVLEEDEYRPDAGTDVGSAEASESTEAPGAAASLASASGFSAEAGTEDENSKADAEFNAGLHSFEDSLVEEVSEELGGVEPGGLRDAHPEPDDLGSEDGHVAAAETESASVEGAGDAEGGGVPEVDPGELDTLPDIEAFSGDFASDVGTGGGAGRGSGSSAGASSQREGDSSDQDPSVMAKALQTMLKRDEQRK